ncbi:MAG: exodeoxyribonuclease VII large subunit [Ruthenibacterium sp.]
MANVITVTALNQYVKALLEHDAVLTDIAIRGEISNFVNHFKTGHFYFTLKDAQCSVKAVMFRSNAQALGFLPQNGMRVIARCRISLFERDGAFQIYVDDLFPDGIGAMQLAFEQLKQKLETEGLFAQEIKKPLPRMPHIIGLVTSKTGAAIQDIFNVTKRRYPMAHFLLAPVTVQGNESADGIANAIATLDKSGKVDVIIVARGGGSREDLWVFNSELIARAAFACKTPLVSAIGHEIDFSILDFVADLRAPTPSAAAELVMPDIYAEFEKNIKIYTNIHKQIQRRVDLCYNIVNHQKSAPSLLAMHSVVAKKQADTMHKYSAISAQVQNILQRAHTKMSHAAALSMSLNPQAILARGYAIASVNGTALKSVQTAKPQDAITVRLADGTLSCTVNTIESEDAK